MQWFMFGFEDPHPVYGVLLKKNKIDTSLFNTKLYIVANKSRGGQPV